MLLLPAQTRVPQLAIRVVVSLFAESRERRLM